ncbi:MAG: Activator of Hsp90 ATPase 1 family protein [Myxococcaceae bacterium]|nr:Activator of Hsp90 ATPase 1 family protein [Myxococcaceae bacterium]
MSNTEIDRKTFKLTFQRSLQATCAEVFDAWTRPEQVAEWWDPTGARLVECAIDLRPGGAFRFANEGHSMPFAGTYKVIERPAKLVFEAQGSLGTVSLEAAGNETRMHVTIQCASAEQLEQLVKLGVQTNTDKTLDNLVRRLASQAAGRQAR